MHWLATPAVMWSLTGLLALTFFAAGGSKVAAIEPSPANFARWGLSRTVMRAVGAAEVLGAIGLLVPIPHLAGIAAIGLILMMLGAIRTGVVYKEPLHVVLPAVLIVLLAVVVWLRV